MRRADSGFTLIETIVSLAILAIITVVCANSVAVGLRGVDATESRDSVVRVARSVLARVGHTIPLSIGSYSGSEDDPQFSWTADVTLYSPEPSELTITQPSIAGYWIRVTARRSATTSRSAHQFELYSFKVSQRDGT